MIYFLPSRSFLGYFVAFTHLLPPPPPSRSILYSFSQNEFCASPELSFQYPLPSPAFSSGEFCAVGLGTCQKDFTFSRDECVLRSEMRSGLCITEQVFIQIKAYGKLSSNDLISHNHSTLRTPFPLAAAASSVHRTHSLPQ